jgi:hypothetical protein
LLALALESIANLFNELMIIFKFNILLAYISCRVGFHCEISIYAYNVPWLDSPPITLPHPLPPYLNQFQQVSSFYFHIRIHST